MMSADPGFILLQPGSLEIIRALREFREQTGAFITFTIDAGPNIHLIYPEEEKGRVQEFIKGTLIRYCHQDQWIDDRLGRGPLELST
jgi:diphosphomevalonate decarboxylase